MEVNWLKGYGRRLEIGDARKYGFIDSCGLGTKKGTILCTFASWRKRVDALNFGRPQTSRTSFLVGSKLDTVIGLFESFQLMPL